MNFTKITRIIRQSMPFIIALFSFLILITGTLSYLNYKKDRWKKDVKIRVSEILMTKKTMLERALYSRIYYTKSVAAYVSLKPDLLNSEFYNLAAELINNDSVICTMALSKNCIINAVYPLEGHESAIGLDLLTHPERKEIVEKTIETRKTFIAGPVELVEGGVAFISYTPIFDKTSGRNNKFWGVTDIVIYQDKIIEEATLNKNESGFLFAIRGYNGLGVEGDVWWGDEKVFEQNPITVNVNLPYGNWVLAATPELGWSSYFSQDNVLLILLIISSLIISTLIWLISRAIVKIRRNEQELKAIFNSIDSLIIEFNHEGRYMKIPLVNSELLIKPKEELLNKTLYEILPEEKAKMLHNAILACLENKKLIEFEYPLQIGGKNKWFAARVSWKSELSVIFHAIDITEQKNIRERIVKSEQQLKELNATKDKFFSIIAHDLKGPFNSLIGFSELLIDEVKNGNYSNVEKFSTFIYLTSKKTFNLVLNLLEWSRSQTGKIEFSPESILVSNLIDEINNLLISQADKKGIKLINKISCDLTVFGDKNMLETVIRNLVSNAIKYSRKGGIIIIESVELKDSIQISVSDNGVGISEENIEKLFLIEHNISTLGTDNENGTGLGLILCKEFVDKHNGEIWVESEVGKGSEFKFILPVKST